MLRRIIIVGETCSARDLAEKREPMERLWNNLAKDKNHQDKSPCQFLNYTKTKKTHFEGLSGVSVEF